MLQKVDIAKERRIREKKNVGKYRKWERETDKFIKEAQSEFFTVLILPNNTRTLILLALLLELLAITVNMQSQNISYVFEKVLEQKIRMGQSMDHTANVVIGGTPLEDEITPTPTSLTSDKTKVQNFGTMISIQDLKRENIKRSIYFCLETHAGGV